jgi:hypothetical protein
MQTMIKEAVLKYQYYIIEYFLVDVWDKLFHAKWNKYTLLKHDNYLLKLSHEITELSALIIWFSDI